MAIYPAGANTREEESMRNKDILPIIPHEPLSPNASFERIIGQLLTAQRDADWERIKMLVEAALLLVQKCHDLTYVFNLNYDLQPLEEALKKFAEKPSDKP